MSKYTKEELYKMDAIDIYNMVLKGDIIKKFPDGFWQQPEAKQNAAKCTKYLIEDVLKYNEEKLKQISLVTLFNRNKLRGMLSICFKESPYEAINNAYPNKFKEWELKTVPNRFWEDKQNAINATKWLIEDKLKLSDEEIKTKLSNKIFKDNGLGGMIQYSFNCSPYEAINSVYPNRFKEWEFKTVPNGFWESNKENSIIAIKWLIEDKLKLSDEEIKTKLSFKIFKDNGLGGMLKYYFKGSPYEAINSAYPNRFKEWEFNYVPNGYWKNKTNVINATKWLIEEKLKLSDEELKEQLSLELFRDNGLGGMIQYSFNNSPYQAINSVYPNKFKEWEFKNVPIGFWNNKENGVRATKWLIEDKLKLTDDELKNKLSLKMFIENGLSGMIKKTFNNSPYEAINNAYPRKFKEWEFKNVPNRFWKNKHNAICAGKWLIEDKLNLSDKELKEQLSVKMFKENGLGGMLDICFNASPYEAINNIYPNKFTRNDFKK